MFRNIIVALDGSPTAEQAIPIAAGIARRAGARLRLVHALDYLHTDYPNCPECTEWWSENTYDRAARYLEQLAASGLEKWHVPIETTLIESDALAALLRSREARQADLTVMTTHGRGPVERFWLGSVADHVIREAGCPVLVVPAVADPQLVRDDRPFTHMLVPLDGSETAERVLHHAAHLASAEGSKITLVRATQSMLVHTLNYEPANLTDEAASQQYFTDRRKTLAWMAREIDCAMLNGVDSVATQILDYASAHDADVIALATHGRGGLRRLVLGSVADKVIRGSSVPVLVVKNQCDPEMHA